MRRAARASSSTASPGRWRRRMPWGAFSPNPAWRWTR
ncbi:hypothetical protein MGSAQ_000297 [marine sediment metagenome]|uniref:Uncharacterized protein n=1 Tax=marine sediment metagenome TaxID=412755 RepID=A0A1B6NYX0_9ZZZZ